MSEATVPNSEKLPVIQTNISSLTSPDRSNFALTGSVVSISTIIVSSAFISKFINLLLVTKSASIKDSVK